MVDTDVGNRIMVEIATGKPPAVPDTPEMAEYRAAVAAEMAQAKASGMMLQIPND